MASERTATTPRQVDKADLVITVAGHLVKERATAFQQELDAAIAGDAQHVALDLRAVESMSSACVGKILMCHHELQDGGRKLTVMGCSDPVMEMFRLIKIDRLITIDR